VTTAEARTERRTERPGRAGDPPGQEGPSDPRARAAARAGAARGGLRAAVPFAEALLLALAFPAIGWAIDRSDPFLLRQPFSWLIVPPILAGLRHGFAAGLVSAAVIDGGIAIAWRLGKVSTLPTTAMLATVALAMACGQITEVWRRDLAHLESERRGFRRQLDEALRAAFLLEVANDRLAARAGEGVPNLREALVALQRLEGTREPNLAQLGQSCLDVFAEYGLIESAALHGVASGVVSPGAVATLGGARDVDPEDPLVRYALRTKRLAIIPTGGGDLSGRGASPLLAVVPFVDTDDVVRGVLAIEAMPLSAFDRRNLQTLFLLGGHFADLLRSGGGTTEVERGRRVLFLQRLERALRDLRENALPSFVLGMTVARNSPMTDILGDVLSTLRRGDFPLVLRNAAGDHALLILFHGTADVDGVRRRLDGLVARELRIGLEDAGVKTLSHVLDKDDHAEEVRDRLLDEVRAR
jgi:hypothetical protein